MSYYLFRRQPQDNPPAPNAARSLRRIGRLSFWLLLSACFILAHFVTTILAMSTVMDSLDIFTVTPATYFTVAVLYCTTRISVSYAQARASYSPLYNRFSPCEVIKLTHWTGVLRFKASVWTTMRNVCIISGQVAKEPSEYILSSSRPIQTILSKCGQ